MSSALVPGRIRRAAAWSRLLKNFCCSGEAGTGDSWSSAIGGGLGRRGDAGEAIAVAAMGRLPVAVAKSSISSKRRLEFAQCCGELSARQPELVMLGRDSPVVALPATLARTRLGAMGP